MRLVWIDKEAVYIPVLERRVHEGMEFEIDEQYGQDLVNRGMARPVALAAHGQPKKKDMVERRDIHVVITDNVGVGEGQ